MWNNAGLSTSILITTFSPANGMVHHTVAKIFVSTKLRDLGPKASAARTFWRMVATCIRYQPPTEHLLRDLITFSLASVRSPCVGTGFLGLACPLFPPTTLDDTPEFPKIPSICLGYHVSAIESDNVLRLAMITPLPPVGLLETVQLSLKEGETLSESTVRRLRRKETERRVAAAEGRNPVSEYKKRKLKKIATRNSAQQEVGELSSKTKSSTRRLETTSATETHSPPSHKPTVEFVGAVKLYESERRIISVEDVERLAASASVCRRPGSPGKVSSHV